jgi:hypothetical protein
MHTPNKTGASRNNGKNNKITAETTPLRMFHFSSSMTSETLVRVGSFIVVCSHFLFRHKFSRSPTQSHPLANVNKRGSKIKKSAVWVFLHARSQVKEDQSLLSSPACPGECVRAHTSQTHNTLTHSRKIAVTLARANSPSLARSHSRAP